MGSSHDHAGRFTLRTLTIDDWPLWRDVRLAALVDAPHAFKARFADWSRGGEQQWRARFELPGAYHLIALSKGDSVGMARGVPADGEAAELRSVWVAPTARGSGVGDELVTAVSDWAVRAGRSTLTLTVIPGNESAVALYRRHGFVDTGEAGSLLLDGVTRELVMAKSLR